jgi:hypothetical protein
MAPSIFSSHLACMEMFIFHTALGDNATILHTVWSLRQNTVRDKVKARKKHSSRLFRKSEILKQEFSVK